jgi:hypothetical protein
MAILRNVAKTDTLEIQRQTINSIANDLYNIGSGGSNLSTGILKLGDGTRIDPSLSFSSDTTLGIYKSSLKTMAFVSGGRKIYQYNNDAVYAFRNLILQKNSLRSAGLTLTTPGQNYDAGSYTNIACIGGTGELGTFDIVVSAYSGSTTAGSGYTGTVGIGGGSTVTFSNVTFISGSGTGALGSVDLDVNTGGFVKTTITTYGTGYAVNDQLTLPVTAANKTATITLNQSTITLTSTAGIYPGFIITKNSGTGAFTPPMTGDITVSQVLSDTSLQVSTNGSVSGTANLTFTPPWGTGTGYKYTINTLGVVTSASVNTAGNGYSIGDTITAYNLDLTQPVIYTVTAPSVTVINFTTNVASSAINVGDSLDGVTSGPSGTVVSVFTVIEKTTSGANISALTLKLVGAGSISADDTVRKTGTTTPTWTVNTATQTVRFYINKNDGNGAILHPSLTLYKDSKYKFDYSGASNHPLKFSIHQDGVHNQVTGVTSTVSTSSSQITVSSATGILIGMTVTKDSSVIGENGALSPNTTVTNVVGTTVTLSSAPSTSGAITLIFTGAIYSGSEVTTGSGFTTIQPKDTTPSTLYYFCDGGSTHTNEAGFTGQAAVVTINLTNPKIFGTGFLVTVDDINSTDTLTANVANGNLTATSVTSTTAAITSGNISTLTSPLINGTAINATSLTSATSLSLSGTSVDITGDFNIGSTIQAVNSSGNLTTSGILKTTNTLNINDILTISNNTISTSSGNSILLNPPTGRVAKVTATTAFVIPSGNTSQRPTSGIVENGSIRYNTDTNQYEGYSGSSSSWSSLGGVRDLDGNTYIAAEATVGANDNTLYFYNDGLNTEKLTPFEHIFNTVKSISSVNTTAPASILWSANTPVTVGQYINYGFNLYQVTTGGSTGSPSSPPIHTTGAATNGTATLTWYDYYVDQLTFGKVSQVNVGTTSLPTTLVINGGLKLYGDTISTTTNDLVLYPYAGKKVTVNATSSLVLPTGTTGQRGVPGQGSVRYNTTITQFEGYNGANWTSLGGVKDVDGNTYIIPELSPGSNENILYFYNNGSNSIQLSTTALDFKSVDNITSSISNTLDIDVSTVNYALTSFTIDNTGTTTTKLLTTRTNLDIAISSGLTADTLLRLNSSGDIYLNKTYATGTPTYIKVIDNELKVFELDDTKIETNDLQLVRGTTEFGLVTIFTPSIHSGAKIVIIANNVTNDNREIIEYNVTSKNSDIFYTEYDNLLTGADQISVAFDFDLSGNVRVTPTLASSLTVGDIVDITVIKTIFKK